MPEIIEGGFLYKVYPPLYRIDNPDHPFMKNKAELTELYLKKVVKNFKIRVVAHRGTDYLNKDELWTFLYNTIYYMEILEEMYNFYKVEKGLLEVVALGLVRYNAINTSMAEPIIKEERLKEQSFIRDFTREIQKKYPEMTFDGKNIKGVIKGSGMKSIRLNQRFVTKMAELIPIYMEYDYMLYVKEKGCEELKMTIGEFLSMSSKLRDQIKSRFKGLGEADADELWETTLDPARRNLVRLTFDNIERDKEIFNKLKSDKAVYAKQRKQMIEAYKLKREDLDT